MVDRGDPFRALADPSRRELLDRLRERNGQSLRELGDGLGMARQSVTKHLAVLEDAGLVVTERRGREKLHFLNAAPINQIADRWISRYHQQRTATLADLARALEDPTVSTTDFVYVSYIRTTPERLWTALTDASFIARYFGGGGPRSDWQVGSAVEWSMGNGDQLHDWGQRVVEADPPRRLVYTWHNYQPEMQPMFGWDGERLAELQREPVSQVAFTLEPDDDTTKLTVVHDGFVPDSEMLRGVSQGWPKILSLLKSVVEGAA